MVNDITTHSRNVQGLKLENHPSNKILSYYWPDKGYELNDVRLGCTFGSTAHLSHYETF